MLFAWSWHQACLIANNCLSSHPFDERRCTNDQKVLAKVHNSIINIGTVSKKGPDRFACDAKTQEATKSDEAGLGRPVMLARSPMCHNPQLGGLATLLQWATAAVE